MITLDLLIELDQLGNKLLESIKRGCGAQIESKDVKITMGE